jgi:hypothetical protein
VRLAHHGQRHRIARCGPPHVQGNLAAARGDQLQPALGHLQAQFAQLVGQQALGVRNDQRFLVGHMVHYVAHPLGHRVVVVARLGFHLPKQVDQPTHFLVLRERLGNAIVLRDRAHRGTEDFFF